MMILFTTTLGLIIGSFLNAAIYRLRSKKPGLLSGRSACPHCDHTLSWQDLIPIVSWLLLKDKCRYCQASIGVHYPLVEFTTATSFAVVTWQIGTDNLFTLGWYLLVTAILIFLAAYDWLYGEISDEVSLSAIGLSIVATILSSTPTLINSLIGLTLGGGLFLTIVLVSNGRWMGGGDIRLGALLGALLGWQGVLLAIFLAALIGSVAGGALMAMKQAELKTSLPFAPLLALGGVISLLWGDQLITWYLINLL